MRSLHSKDRMLNFSDFFAQILAAGKSFPNFACRKSGGMHPAYDEALHQAGTDQHKTLTYISQTAQMVFKQMYLKQEG